MLGLIASQWSFCEIVSYVRCATAGLSLPFCTTLFLFDGLGHLVYVAGDAYLHGAIPIEKQHKR